LSAERRCAPLQLSRHAAPSRNLHAQDAPGAQGGPEKQLSLEGIAAPRLGRWDGSSAGEPWAEESRDFLRSLAIGKAVTFRLETAGPGGRETASVFMSDLNLSQTCVAAGWARARGDPVSELLAQAEQAAAAAQLGLWCKQPAPPVQLKAADVEALSAPVTALVESVLNGATFRFTLPQSREFCTGLLAGVQCPSMGKKPVSDGADPVVEPFAREAKAFSEGRVLHRLVLLTPCGVDAYGTLCCSLSFEPPGGEAPLLLAEALLRAGLARVSERTLHMLPPGAAPLLRAAEGEAVQSRLAQWQSLTPPTSGAAAAPFAAHVLEVLSGDLLLLADSASGEEHRVSLSSTRAPRIGNARKGEPPASWALASKEFLVQHLLGKTVVVQPDFLRRLGGAEEEVERTLQCATVFETRPRPGGGPPQRRSVAELLVAHGLALVARPRPGEERAPRHEQMLAAEEQARAAKRGMHGAPEEALPAQPTLQDVSRDAGRARAFLSTLQRAGRSQARVDFCLSASRLKLLLVGKERLLLLFSPAGIRCPRAGDAGAAEALAFVRRTLLQRDVEVEIESLDKKGVFVGALHYSSALGPRTPLARTLVEAGLATVVGSHPVGLVLREAEAKARDARLGLWKDWEPSAEVEPAEEGEDDEEALSPSAKDYLHHGGGFNFGDYLR